MNEFIIHPWIWPLMGTSLMLMGLAGICIGIPGNSRLKWSLFWATLCWVPLPPIIGALFIYDHNDHTPPYLLVITLNLGILLVLLRWGIFFYAMMERKRDNWFKSVEAIFLISAFLTVFIEEFHGWDNSGRLLLPAFNMAYMDTILIIYMIQSYRHAEKNSTMRKRIFINFANLIWVAFFVFVPYSIAAAMGLFPDPIVANALMNLIFIASSVVALYLIISRYNLVKVELDKVGEGLFRDIDSPVLLLSKNHEIIKLNPKASDIFYLEEEMEHSPQSVGIETLLPDFNPSTINFDVSLDTKMGQREFECKLSKVYQMDEILGSLVVFHDVTRERELARMKTEFTSTVSHELRTPLTSILGFAKIIDKRFSNIILPKFEAEGKKEQRAVKQINKNLGVIISESNRLTALINDVLDISKMEAGKVDWKFAKTTPLTFIEQAINATTGLFANKPSLTLITDIPNDLPEVVVDSDRVVQVIINLISNAVKFTDAGEITIGVSHNWSSMTLQVKDQGTGISEADQPLVFEKYKQVGEIDSEKPKGTGLGLPISKEIVEYHGGRIWVDSALGEGSTFAFSLPLANVVDAEGKTIDKLELVNHLDAIAAPRTRQSQKVLIVDDDQAIREVLKQLIEEAGFESIEATDGMEGLQKVRKEQPDLIILDVMMPRLNGFDCAAAIKGDKQCRHIPIMMLTVLDDAQRAYGLGVESYLTKPFEPNQVLMEINRLLTRNAAEQRVVVLGSTTEAKQVVDLLNERNTPLTQVENIGDLTTILHAQKPNLLVIADSAFQQTEVRLKVQNLAGSSACLVLHYQEGNQNEAHE